MHWFKRKKHRKLFENWMIFRTEEKIIYIWIAQYFIYTCILFMFSLGEKNNKERKIWSVWIWIFLVNTYRSSKNINFNSMLARNINIFRFSLISVIEDDGNEWPTATNPKFCTQLWPSPYTLSIWNTLAFKYPAQWITYNYKIMKFCWIKRGNISISHFIWS